MKITITRTGPPLNHTYWKIVYLLCILLSLMFAPVGKAEVTNKVTSIQRVEYHNRILENYIQYLKLRRLLNVSEKETSASRVQRLSRQMPSSPNTQTARRRQKP
ncbi:MAG: hypothetical protein AB1757_06740 [Acidobacteriota bacterium]